MKKEYTILLSLICFASCAPLPKSENAESNGYLIPKTIYNMNEGEMFLVKTMDKYRLCKFRHLLKIQFVTFFSDEKGRPSGGPIRLQELADSRSYPDGINAIVDMSLENFDTIYDAIESLNLNKITWFKEASRDVSFFKNIIGAPPPRIKPVSDRSEQ